MRRLTVVIFVRDAISITSSRLNVVSAVHRMPRTMAGTVPSEVDG